MHLNPAGTTSRAEKTSSDTFVVGYRKNVKLLDEIGATIDSSLQTATLSIAEDTLTSTLTSKSFTL